jgi:hypothetical protein
MSREMGWMACVSCWRTATAMGHVQNVWRREVWVGCVEATEQGQRQGRKLAPGRALMLTLHRICLIVLSHGSRQTE